MKKIGLIHFVLPYMTFLLYSSTTKSSQTSQYLNRNNCIFQ